MAPPAGLSGSAGGESGARGGTANQGRNANNTAPSAAAAAAGAPPPPLEEPLADGGILPRDAALVKGLLRSMGALEYEPSVVPQLLDFLYRYVSETLSDADSFAEAAGLGGALAPDQISLALAARETRNAGGGAPPPSLAALTVLASARNERPLPGLARAHGGLHPPPDADALLAQGYSVPAAPRELPLPVRRGEKKEPAAADSAAAAASAAAAKEGGAGGSGRAGAARRRGNGGGGGADAAASPAPAPSSRPQAPRGGGRVTRRRGAAPAPGNKLGSGSDDEMGE